MAGGGISTVRSVLPLALLLGSAAVHRYLLSRQQARRGEHEEGQDLVLKQVMAAAAAAAPAELVVSAAEEWYTVSIAQVPMGYLHTTTALDNEGGDRGPLVKTSELMDVQVSRGTDTARVAFYTEFEETGLLGLHGCGWFEGWLRRVEAALYKAVGMRGWELLRGGRVSTMAYDQRYAQSETKMKYSFAEHGGTATLTSHNGNAEHLTQVAVPSAPWMGRMRARLEFARRCRSGEVEICVQTMKAELGPTIITLESHFVQLVQMWDGDRMVNASEWHFKYNLPLPDGTVSDSPVSTREFYATHGPERCYRMLQMHMDMPFGYLVATLSSKEAALKAAQHDPSRKLPELVMSLNVILAAPIPHAHAARRIVMAVSIKHSKGPAKLELPTSGYQRVALVDEDAQQLRVTIDLTDPVAATEEELRNKEYLAPSAMVDSADDKIVELAHSIDARLEEMRSRGALLETVRDHSYLRRVARGKPVVSLQQAIALRLRELVRTHITEKNYQTTYASASETARTRTGDCSEHAVLLSALLRARGIPSRVCHGLVYLEERARATTSSSSGGGQAGVGAHGTVGAELVGQLGWHMWSQALIDGHWHDLDATLHVPYSVGHVLVGTSSMSDKEAQSSHMNMAPLVGNLAIAVREVGHDWD